MTTASTDRIAEIEKQLLELKQERTRLRRELPDEPIGDYDLKRPDGTPTTLSALFGDRDELIVVHNMGRACSYCTLWADGFSSLTDHLLDRSAFCLLSPDEPEVLKEFSESRGWRYPVASFAGTMLAQEMGFYKSEGEHTGYWPGASALKKTEGGIVRTGKTSFGPGDDYCSIWHFHDMLPPAQWAPQYSYGKPSGGSCGSGCGCA